MIAFTNLIMFVLISNYKIGVFDIHLSLNKQNQINLYSHEIYHFEMELH